MNRRRCNRARFIALAPVKDLLTDSTLGYIGDISTGGMMLFSPRAVAQPGHRRVAITLPRHDGETVTVTGEIRIAWHRPAERGTSGSTGCQFVNFNPGEKLTLLRSAREFSLRA